MGVEIERKFIVDKNLFKPSEKGELVHQVYLKRNDGRSVRVRIIGTNAFITIKSTITAMVKNEFEYAIPLQDAEEIIEIFKDLPSIKKIRYQQIIDGDEWVIDKFLGDNEGLLMAEIELSSTSTSFSKPAWLLHEVTDDFRFHNSSLAAFPFKEWKEEP